MRRQVRAGHCREIAPERENAPVLGMIDGVISAEDVGRLTECEPEIGPFERDVREANDGPSSGLLRGPEARALEADLPAVAFGEGWCRPIILGTVRAGLAFQSALQAQHLQDRQSDRGRLRVFDKG